MLRIMLKSKIHNGTVTDANLQYKGSITIDAQLLKAADILPGERVQIVNLNNGTRVETYAMKGRPNSGTICMNGAAARWAQIGDKIIIISYGLMEAKESTNNKPKIILVNGKNKIKEQK